MWDAIRGNVCLTYHGRVIFEGAITGGPAHLTNTVEWGRGLEQTLVLSGKGISLSALAHGSTQMLAAETRTPVIARGMGSGLAAGSIPATRGGIVVSLNRMNHILWIYPENR